MAIELNGIVLGDDILASLLSGNEPNKNFINDFLGSFSSFETANPETLNFYETFVINHPESVLSDQERNAVLNAYANYLYPSLGTYSEGTVPLDNDKTKFIAKLNNGLQSFKKYLINENLESYVLDKAREIFGSNDSYIEAEPFFQSQAGLPVNTPYVNAFDLPLDNEVLGPIPQTLQEVCTTQPFLPACNVEEKTPTSTTGSGLFGEQTQQEAGQGDLVESSAGTSKSQPRVTSVNSWVISWEPTQKVGIVKVPLSKLLTALGDESSSKNVNNLEFYNDTLFFNIDELIDFKSVNRRIFLPLASNRMVILKEFSIARKNIQQVELTHGSKYFQVFTETFPEFTLNIEAVKFADVAKKVKLFFDNVMKRVSETSKYSGSLYIYDVLAEKIPSFELSELVKNLESGELIRYRLLPRSVRMATSSEDPNMLKITVDGIIVEWEKQKAKFNIPKLTNTPKDKPQTNEPKLIGKNAKYAETLKEQLFTTTTTSGTSGTNTSPTIFIKRVGNTLYKDANITVQEYFSSIPSSLWVLDTYVPVSTGSKIEYVHRQYEDYFSPGTLNEIYLDAVGIYIELLTYLSINAPKNYLTIDNSDYYNNILIKAMNQIGLPETQRRAFRKGFEGYAAKQALARFNNAEPELLQKLQSFGININI